MATFRPAIYEAFPLWIYQEKSFSLLMPYQTVQMVILELGKKGDEYVSISSLLHSEMEPGKQTHQVSILYPPVIQ